MTDDLHKAATPAGPPDAQRHAPASGIQSEWRDFLDAKIPTTKGDRE